MSNRDDNNLAHFAERYMAQWNESDPAIRRKMIEEIWAPAGAQTLVDPPVEIREAAANLNFGVPALEVRGHDAMDARVSRAYEMFVAPGGYTFEVGVATQLPAGLIGLPWSMISRADGSVAGGGYEVIGLDSDGRITFDHQFIEGVR
ncbi:hypothetical protein [Nocardia pseudovaccinii]|uniref:hypothetical protein n=1 Tax=Nocardia pseudovaccinii TaxID=189540 RepID=UPI0007A4382F|nr:hypothetical protein [Nocardia pseudovaccinii]